MSTPNDEASAGGAARGSKEQGDTPHGAASFFRKPGTIVQVAQASARAEAEKQAKLFAIVKARAALRGWELRRSDPEDGEQRFFVARWGMVRVLVDRVEVEVVLAQVSA